ncbi:hypothetical protein NL676_029015 [Syzygium grande]|nr:hypothetical protein NL676_029015 [Syzygium grande]
MILRCISRDHTRVDPVHVGAAGPAGSSRIGPEVPRGAWNPGMVENMAGRLAKEFGRNSMLGHRLSRSMFLRMREGGQRSEPRGKDMNLMRWLSTAVLVELMPTTPRSD